MPDSANHQYSTLQKKMSLSGRAGIRHKSSLLLNGTSNTPPSSGSNNQFGQSSLLTASHSVPEEHVAPWQNESGHVGSIAGAPALSTAIPSQAPSSALNTVESTVTLAHKRITTLVYLKRVYEGKVHWFNTILLTRPELEKWFDHHRMIGRTTRFAVLGMSISSLLDIVTLQDFLKGMINLMHDYESIPDDDFKPSFASLSRGIFKQSSKGGRKSTGAADYSLNLQDSSDSSFLYSANIPFELDYFEVWITLSDILVQVYQKIIYFISPSGSLPNGTSLSVGSPTTTHISAPLPPNRPSSVAGSGGLPANLTPTYLEMIVKVDSKIKKLVIILTKEIDGLARAAIREELAQLDPMLTGSVGPLATAVNDGDWDLPV